MTSCPNSRCHTSSAGKPASAICPAPRMTSEPIGTRQFLVSRKVRRGSGSRARPEAEDARVREAEDAQEDRIVRRVGQRAFVAAVLHVDRHVPPDAESGGQQRDDGRGTSAARPSAAARRTRRSCRPAGRPGCGGPGARAAPPSRRPRSRPRQSGRRSGSPRTRPRRQGAGSRRRRSVSPWLLNMSDTVSHVNGAVPDGSDVTRTGAWSRPPIEVARPDQRHAGLDRRHCGGVHETALVGALGYGLVDRAELYDDATVVGHLTIAVVLQDPHHLPVSRRFAARQTVSNSELSTAVPSTPASASSWPRRLRRWPTTPRRGL